MYVYAFCIVYQLVTDFLTRATALSVSVFFLLPVYSTDLP